MDDQVTVINASDRAATLGHKAMYPGEKRQVHRGVLAQAQKQYPDVFVIVSQEETSAEPEPGGLGEVDEPAQIPVGTIKGIGPKWAEKLANAGIERIEDLAALDDESAAILIRDLGDVLNEEQLLDWVRQAREILGYGN
jgi:predicted flap endonuclease-1-like 5' DNA nuclease